ncbi:MAG: hypothetical protein HYU97_05635 [Deltaproteobacteria bacterium]|nr:hypothetical protein [Deltaproteobacteria bacterium]
MKSGKTSSLLIIGVIFVVTFVTFSIGEGLVWAQRTLCGGRPLIDDKNACTIEKCINGKTKSLAILVPDDHNPCTIDKCDPKTGKFYHPVLVDDGNACTVDSCHKVKGISHVLVPVDDGISATEDSCDAKTGKITHQFAPCTFLPNGNPQRFDPISNSCKPVSRKIVSFGSNGVCLLETNGEVKCGSTVTKYSVPQYPAIITSIDKKSFKKVEALPPMVSLDGNTGKYGKGHVCGTSWDGYVYCWGENKNGQLGKTGLTNDLPYTEKNAFGIEYTVTPTTRSLPAKIIDLDLPMGAVDVSLGSTASLALMANGELVVWGGWDDYNGADAFGVHVGKNPSGVGMMQGFAQAVNSPTLKGVIAASFANVHVTNELTKAINPKPDHVLCVILKDHSLKCFGTATFFLGVGPDSNMYDPVWYNVLIPFAENEEVKLEGPIEFVNVSYGPLSYFATVKVPLRTHVSVLSGNKIYFWTREEDGQFLKQADLSPFVDSSTKFLQVECYNDCDQQGSYNEAYFLDGFGNIGTIDIAKTWGLEPAKKIRFTLPGATWLLSGNSLLCAVSPTELKCEYDKELGQDQPQPESIPESNLSPAGDGTDDADATPGESMGASAGMPPGSEQGSPAASGNPGTPPDGPPDEPDEEGQPDIPAN